MSIIADAYALYSRTRFPLPSEAQVAAIEKRMQSPLPPDYRRFVLEFNGGYFTEPQIVPTTPGCPIDRLTVLFGIKASHSSAELASKAHLALFDDNLPVAVLPIGYTIMGNLLYLITHEEDCGVVGLKVASRDDYFVLAPDIANFFTLLRTPDDDDDDSD